MTAAEIKCESASNLSLDFFACHCSSRMTAAEIKCESASSLSLDFFARHCTSCMTNRLDHAKMQAFCRGARLLVKPKTTGLVGSFFWIGCIGKLRDERFHTDQWIDPAKHLSYQMPEKPFEINGVDFRKTAMDYLCFKMKNDTANCLYPSLK